MVAGLRFKPAAIANQHMLFYFQQGLNQMNMKPEYCVQNETEQLVVNAAMLLSLLDTDSSSMWVFLHLEQCWQIT